MARPEKDAAVAQLADKFREANAVLLTEYRGLSVADLKELRRSLAGNAEYTVAKNTLASIAARRVGLDAIVDDLKGPTALTFVTGEPVEAAKALRDFAKDNKNLIIKSGVMDGNALTADEIDRLASLESREVLLAKAAGAMKASLSKAAYLFAAPASNAVRTVDALREKQEAAA
ncbi:50S ribosomal protein L10 [Actinomyces ruminis]|uniref:Large ribosomal subunit protein uL10 n=1 Tax=Actinomyces ruminis TaxID=1937003 RepID=A0ABX4MB61_9ACTO|nr:50S ribosomal protein L10 [Actinomyces ruminis]PHP52685.1 50S ribosomal protein L10 [Actinomyces ruminis]